MASFFAALVVVAVALTTVTSASSPRRRVVPAAFATRPPQPSAGVVFRHKQRRRRASPPPGASVYYPDGDHVYDNEDAYPSSDETFGWSSSSTFSGPKFGRIADLLSSDPTMTSALARLASAFSPPGFAVDLANVNGVRCLSVDDRHMEIEAVVCDDLQCSSLLVPVDFPEACDANLLDEGLEACVLRNLDSLDAEGDRVLREREQVFAEEEEARRAFEALQSLDSEYLKSADTSSPLPVWWKPPLSASDVDECDLLQKLLNGDDFRKVLRGLAEHALLWHDYEDLHGGKTIRTVRVKAVGPSGMVMRAQLSLGGKTYHDEGGSNNEVLMDVPIKFDDMSPFRSMVGKRSIREEVLMLVSLVQGG